MFKLVTVVILLVMSFLQGVLAYFFEDMLQAYLGITIPGGDVDESFGFPIYIVIVSGMALVSAGLYWGLEKRQAPMKVIFVLAPYAVPLWWVHNLLTSMHADKPLDRVAKWYSQQSMIESSWYCVGLVALFLVFQASVPFWISKALRRS